MPSPLWWVADGCLLHLDGCFPSYSHQQMSLERSCQDAEWHQSVSFPQQRLPWAPCTFSLVPASKVSVHLSEINRKLFWGGRLGKAKHESAKSSPALISEILTETTVEHFILSPLRSSRNPSQRHQKHSNMHRGGILGISHPATNECSWFSQQTWRKESRNTRV